MKYFKAVDSAGRVHTRSSRLSDYHFAVTAGPVASWASDLELAIRRTGSFAYYTRSGGEVEVIHAHEIDAKEYRALKRGWTPV